MTVICPSVTATNPHQYREQLERVETFAKRLHLDFMDGELTSTQSPPVESAWWPDDVLADLHIMYKRPDQHLDKIVHLKPHLAIFHAEAEGHFIGMAQELHKAGIKAGVALLSKTPVDVIKPSLDYIDHVLIFSGNLGHFGGTVDMSLLTKVTALKKLKKSLEIGWDGGINITNVVDLVNGGVDVLNVGGFIQKARDPSAVYATLEALAGKQI